MQDEIKRPILFTLTPKRLSMATLCLSLSALFLACASADSETPPRTDAGHADGSTTGDGGHTGTKDSGTTLPVDAGHPATDAGKPQDAAPDAKDASDPKDASKDAPHDG
jgi:hypothetical protein